MHRGASFVYYELKQNYHWPGVKNQITDKIKKCLICELNNQKKCERTQFITTSRLF